MKKLLFALILLGLSHFAVGQQRMVFWRQNGSHVYNYSDTAKITDMRPYGSYYRIMANGFNYWLKPDTTFGGASWMSITGKPTYFSTIWDSVHSKPSIPVQYDSASVAGSVAWVNVSGKPTIPSQYDSASVAGAVAWGSVSGKPSTFTPAAHTQDWSTITGQPSIPSANDSAGKAGSAWAFVGLDTTTFKSHVLLGNAATATSATQFSGLDSTTYKAHVLTGTAANATTFKTKDTTYFARVVRALYMVLDTTKVIAAKRTAIALTGITATDRAWVVWADSTSGNRKRGLAGVCKANSLIVHADTTAGTINALIFR